MQSPPPTEYFRGIQFNPFYYQSWDEPVTKLYVDTNFLKCVGYAYSRAIVTSFSGVINADGGINTTNISMTNTTTTATNLINMNYNTTNGLRFQQAFVAANDIKYNVIQKHNNVDINTMTYYRGNIGIGNTAPAATDKLSVTGNTKITGTATIDTNLVVGGSAGIVGTSQFTGNVGIGTAPTTNLHIYNATNSRLLLDTTTTGTAALEFRRGTGFDIQQDFRLINDTDSTLKLQYENNQQAYGDSVAQLLWVLPNVTTGLLSFKQWKDTEFVGNIGIGALPSTTATTKLNITGDAAITGNIGVGKLPSATFKIDVNGSINATSILVNGATIGGSRWSLIPSTTNIFYNTGNVGIGASTTSYVDDNTVFAIPTARLYVRGGESAGGTCDVVFRGGVAGQNNGKARLWLTADASHASYIESGHTGSGNTYLTFGTASGNALPTERIRINSNGNVAIQSAGQGIGPSNMSAGSLCLGNTNQNYGGGSGWNPNTAGLLFECADATEIAVHDGGTSVHSFMYYSSNGNFRIGRNMGWGTANVFFSGIIICDSEIRSANDIAGSGGGGIWRLSCPDSWVRLRDANNSGHRDFAAGTIYAHTDIHGRFTSVGMTGTDYLCIQQNAGSLGQGLTGFIRSAFGSFTAFHRCYTDDVLYDEENSDIFKNDYMGRVVIATGKIKTDLSRDKEPTEPEPESDIKKAPDNEWYTQIDKDGISIEDTIPVVQLSRQKKDKRVFGVLGAPKRNTNNPNRLIVNSIGEGGITVSNTNGNIENGDYIQSSDLLGYGEKQDDDLLHNYTIAKSTIDCNFELDSPYYQCHEIENGVRVAFIACSYHCG